MKLKPGKPSTLSKADQSSVISHQSSVTAPTAVIDTKENQTPTSKLLDNKMALTRYIESSSPLSVANTNNHINIMCNTKEHQISDNNVRNIDINDIDLSRLTISSEIPYEVKVSSLDYANELVQGIEMLNLSKSCRNTSENNNEGKTINKVEELNIKLEAENEENVEIKIAHITSLIGIEEVGLTKVLKEEDRSARASIGSEEDEEVKEDKGGVEEKEQRGILPKPKDVTALVKHDTLFARSPMKGHDGAREQRMSHMRPYKSCSRSHQCGGTIVVSEPDLSDFMISMVEFPNQLLPPNIDPNSNSNYSPESNIGPDSPQYAYCQPSISPIQGDYAGPYVYQANHSPLQGDLVGNFVPSPAIGSSVLESLSDDILTDMIQQAANDPVFMRTMEQGLCGNLDLGGQMEKENVPEAADFIPETVMQLSNSSLSPVSQSPAGLWSPGATSECSLSARLQVVPHTYRPTLSSNSSLSPGAVSSIHSPFSSPSLSPEASNHLDLPFDIILESSSDDLSPKVQEIKEYLETYLLDVGKLPNSINTYTNGPQQHLATSNVPVSHLLGSNAGPDVTYLPISPGYNNSVPDHLNGFESNNAEMQIVPDTVGQSALLNQNAQHNSTVGMQQPLAAPLLNPSVIMNPNGLPLMPQNLQNQQDNIYGVNVLPSIVVPAPDNISLPPISANLESVRVPKNTSDLTLLPNQILLVDSPSQQLSSNVATNNLVYVVQIPTTSASLGQVQIPTTSALSRQRNGDPGGSQFRSIVPSAVLPPTTPESGKERLLARCSKQKKEAAWVRISSLSDEDLMSGEEKDGDTQLMILVSNGASQKYPEILYSIVERLKKIPGGLTAVNNHQMSALYHACYHNEPLAARYLAETLAQLNVNPDQEKKDGNGLLHMLCRRGDSHVQVLAELLAVKNANGQLLFNVNKHNHSEGTPLHVAVDTHGISGVTCINTVHLLLNMGANILEQERRGGNTALHSAVTQSCCPLLVHTLLRPEGLPGRATGVVNSTNYTRNTPLHLLCPRADVPRERQLKVVKLLLDHGAVGGRLNHNGKAPLALVAPDRKEAIKSLLHRR